MTLSDGTHAMRVTCDASVCHAAMRNYVKLRLLECVWVYPPTTHLRMCVVTRMQLLEGAAAVVGRPVHLGTM